MAKKKATKKRKTETQKLKERMEAMELLDSAYLRLNKAKEKLKGHPRCTAHVKRAIDNVKKAEKACAL